MKTDPGGKITFCNYEAWLRYVWSICNNPAGQNGQFTVGYSQWSVQVTNMTKKSSATDTDTDTDKNTKPHKNYGFWTGQLYQITSRVRKGRSLTSF